MDAESDAAPRELPRLAHRKHQGEDADDRTINAAFPYAIHTVLTDNGIAFADQPRYRNGPTAQFRGHAFGRVCRAHRIAHTLTRPYHPWTNGQAEWMIRTVKDATVKAFHHETLESLAAHLLASSRPTTSPTT